MNPSRIKKVLIIQANHVLSIIRLFFEDRCPTKAAGLSYSSLLAIVPFSAFLFTLFNAFGAFSEELIQLQQFFLDLLMPTHQAELLKLFSSFLSNTNKLGVGGLVLFAVTSVFMLDTITGAFNSLWGSKSKRNLTSKFTTYLSLIVIGSLLLSLGLSVSSKIQKLFPGAAYEQLSIMRKLPIRLIPAVFSFSFLFLLYKTIPASYVQTRSALLGAVWGAFFTEITRYWFLKIANTFIRMSIIYGSLAVIPIFLFWLYVLWLFTLLGLEISYANQFRLSYSSKLRIKGSSLIDQLSTGIEIFLTIAGSFGDRLYSEKRLIKKFRISPESLKEYLDRFILGGLLLEIQPSGPFKSSMWAPAMPLNQIPLQKLFEIILGADTVQSLCTAEFIQSGYALMKERTVQDMLDRNAGPKT